MGNLLYLRYPQQYDTTFNAALIPVSSNAINSLQAVIILKLCKVVVYVGGSGDLKASYIFLCSLAVAFALMFTSHQNGPYAVAKQHTGSSWSIVTAPNVSKTTDVLHSVAASTANDAWAVGWYQSTRNRTLIEHWNGSLWSVMKSPNVDNGDNNLYGVAVLSSKDALAVGDAINTTQTTLSLRWHNRSWQKVATPKLAGPGSLRSIASVPKSEQAWAVGYSMPDGKIAHGLIEHWTGNAWIQVQGAEMKEASNLISVSANSSGDVWILGYLVANGAPFAEHWDGAKWSITMMQKPYFYPTSITALSTHNPWIAGAAIDVKSGASATYTVHRTTQKWVRVNSENPAQNDQLNAVASRSDTDVWAVGFSGALNSHAQDLLTEHWNGNAWSVVPAAKPAQNYNSLQAVTFVPESKSLWAVGFTSQNGEAPFHALIERYQ
jgi:hypothetical protein